MVAPPLLSNPTRVFARLTFTGEDSITQPISCDLSKVASIAAANPLPIKLNQFSGNRAMANTYLKQSNKLVSTNNSLVEIDDSAKAPANNTQSSVAPTLTRKRPNTFTTTDSGRDSSKKVKVSHCSLLAENEHLKKQNEILKKKLHTFQMILQKEESYALAQQRVKRIQMQDQVQQQQALALNVTM